MALVVHQGCVRFGLLLCVVMLNSPGMPMDPLEAQEWPWEGSVVVGSKFLIPTLLFSLNSTVVPEPDPVVPCTGEMG